MDFLTIHPRLSISASDASISLIGCLARLVPFVVIKMPLCKARRLVVNRQLTFAAVNPGSEFRKIGRHFDNCLRRSRRSATPATVPSTSRTVRRPYPNRGTVPDREPRCPRQGKTLPAWRERTLPERSATPTYERTWQRREAHPGCVTLNHAVTAARI